MLTQAFTTVVAAAGGGSSGFGGGGGGGFSGGGGGGFSGGGHYYGGGGTGSALVAVVIVALILVVFLFAVIRAGVAQQRYMAKRRTRVKTVRQASYEAAEDDAWFAADAVAKDAKALFTAVQEAWDRRDEAALAKMVGPDLMVEWKRRLDDFKRKGWHNRVSILQGPKIEYVGIVNRDDDSEDRVVVRIECSLRDIVVTKSGIITHSGSQSEETALCEYWTLVRVDDGWIVTSIEQRAEGDHNLDAEIVASPWSDTQRLRDEAIVEGAVADKVGAGFTTADIATVDFDGTAREEALDLSLADGRFAPDVLEAAVRGAVSAWAEAIDGADDGLNALASPDAVRKLLYGSDAGQSTRVVIRGGRIDRVAVSGVDAKAEPARMTVTVSVEGVRYVENRDTAATVSGSRSDGRFTERWTFALDGPDTAPWRLVAA